MGAAEVSAALRVHSPRGYVGGWVESHPGASTCPIGAHGPVVKRQPHVACAVNVVDAWGRVVEGRRGIAIDGAEFLAFDPGVAVAGDGEACCLGLKGAGCCCRDDGFGGCRGSSGDLGTGGRDLGGGPVVMEEGVAMLVVRLATFIMVGVGAAIAARLAMAVVVGAEIDELEVPFVGMAGSGKTRLGTAEVKKEPSTVGFAMSRLRRLRPP
jgi:hypothetical protein